MTWSSSSILGQLTVNLFQVAQFSSHQAIQGSRCRSWCGTDGHRTRPGLASRSPVATTFFKSCLMSHYQMSQLPPLHLLALKLLVAASSSSCVCNTGRTCLAIQKLSTSKSTTHISKMLSATVSHHSAQKLSIKPSSASMSTKTRSTNISTLASTI